MQWGSWSTLSENADPRLLGQVAVQLRVPRKLSEDTEHRGVLIPFHRVQKQRWTIFKWNSLRGRSPSVSFVVSISFQFTTGLMKKLWGDELGPARLERQLCSFLSHDVMKTWGTFLKSQNLISNEILIIVATKKPQKTPNPHKLVVNFIKPRCLMGIQSIHEWNWTCGQPHTYLASHSLCFYKQPFCHLSLKGEISPLSFLTLRSCQFYPLIVVASCPLPPSYSRCFFGPCSL